MDVGGAQVQNKFEECGAWKNMSRMTKGKKGTLKAQGLIVGID